MSQDRSDNPAVKQTASQTHTTPAISGSAQRCFNTVEPIENFLQCHFEPGDWHKIDTHSLMTQMPQIPAVPAIPQVPQVPVAPQVPQVVPQHSPPADDCCLDMCHFNCDFPVVHSLGGKLPADLSSQTKGLDHTSSAAVAAHSHPDSEPDDPCDFSDYSCDEKYCNVDIPDWNALETCNSVIRCTPEEQQSLADALNTPTPGSVPSLAAAEHSSSGASSVMDSSEGMFNNFAQMLEPELGGLPLPSSNKTSDMRDDLRSLEHKLQHPEKPHIHEHFARNDPHHHYHLHYQNLLNGALVQHDLILPSNFPFDHLSGEFGNDTGLLSEALHGASAPSHHHHHHHHHSESKRVHQGLSPEEVVAKRPRLAESPKLPNAAPPSTLTCKWDDCNLTLPGTDLSKHMAEQHWTSDWLQQETAQPYQCEWIDCMFSTNELDSLFQHIPDVHGNGSAEKAEHHVCQWVDPETSMPCNKEFTDTGALTNHIVSDHIKSGKSEYFCRWKDCPRHGRPFSQRQKVVRHLNTHTKHKPYECSVCKKRFSLDLMLQQHMRIHTGERPYECKVCGKHFKTSSSLTIHSRIHSGDKPMVCTVCGKRFNESSNLNKHMKIHTRRYACEICHKSFNNESRYMKHLAACEQRHAREQNKLQCDCCKDGPVEGSNVTIKDEPV